MKIMKIERREEINHRNIIHISSKLDFMRNEEIHQNIEKIERIKEINGCLMEIGHRNQ